MPVLCVLCYHSVLISRLQQQKSHSLSCEQAPSTSRMPMLRTQLLGCEGPPKYLLTSLYHHPHLSFPLHQMYRVNICPKKIRASAVSSRCCPRLSAGCSYSRSPVTTVLCDDPQSHLHGRPMYQHLTNGFGILPQACSMNLLSIYSQQVFLFCRDARTLLTQSPLELA